MSENETRPIANLITDAREGRLGLRMEPEDFVYIDRDCERFKLAIRAMQHEAQAISEIDKAQWGIGADNAILTSAQTLVDRFRTKGKGSDNSIHAILEDHFRIVEDIQTLHREIRQRYVDADADFAARVNKILARLPEQLTPIDPAQSKPGVGQPEVLAPEGP
ncbi:hypothetical protein [Nocardia bhagyanarayanae]|uniref:PE family protein n=1 Tax=Nocardia bhagyanarayanae TaxID=1215925 RepID=A0A543F500_9NOCA|nr:hypothetical protein [Nocardia bhagyanarayanae]TQM28899.1 hypothetical protein FB390_0478 [Nocardia bhagyanarayanae]